MTTSGSSGSPVVDRRGKVIGVVQSHLGTGQIRFAIACSSVQALLSRANEKDLHPLGELPIRNLIISGAFFAAIGGWLWTGARRRRSRAVVH